MAEIETPIVVDDEGNAIITESHTVGDVVRWAKAGAWLDELVLLGKMELGGEQGVKDEPNNGADYLLSADIKQVRAALDVHNMALAQVGRVVDQHTAAIENVIGRLDAHDAVLKARAIPLCDDHVLNDAAIPCGYGDCDLAALDGKFYCHDHEHEIVGDE